jgi:hypothetical protein
MKTPGFSWSMKAKSSPPVLKGMSPTFTSPTKAAAAALATGTFSAAFTVGGQSGS